MSSLVCYRLGHALQQWDRYPRSTERISCLLYVLIMTGPSTYELSSVIGGGVVVVVVVVTTEHQYTFIDTSCTFERFNAKFYCICRIYRVAKTNSETYNCCCKLVNKKSTDPQQSVKPRLHRTRGVNALGVNGALRTAGRIRNCWSLHPLASHSGGWRDNN